MSEEGLRHVPTLPELVKVGKAVQNTTETRDKNGKVKKAISYRATEEGDREIVDAMIHNGKYLREHPEVSREMTEEAIRQARSKVD